MNVDDKPAVAERKPWNKQIQREIDCDKNRAEKQLLLIDCDKKERRGMHIIASSCTKTSLPKPSETFPSGLSGAVNTPWLYDMS